MSKKVVDGIEISDDVVVSEYEGKFSGSFELEVEKAVSMAYDDEVTLVVQARLDSYTFKPTKYGDLRRINTFKVDSVTVKGSNPSVIHVPEPRQVELIDRDGYKETRYDAYVQEDVFVPEVKETPGSFTPEPAPTGGRDYRDPLLAKFLEDA